MKEIYPLAELTERADAGLLKQLIHLLADKDPAVRRECLNFLKQKITLPTQAIIKVDAEEIWTLWEEVESNLSELDECGNDPEGMEEHLSDCLCKIEDLLKEREFTKKDRAALIEEILPFIHSGNAGMEDLLYDVVYAACKDDEDWRKLAEAFEKMEQDWPLDHARRIYRRIGNHEKYLQLRAKKMIYGLDYYDLVTFYLERGDKDKAIAVAQEGLIKAIGRMNELREFMADHLSKQGNRPEFLKIRFMQMTDGLSVSSYEKFKDECSFTEWKEYELQVLEALQNASLHVQLKIRMLRQEHEQALCLLQKIGYSNWSWGNDSALEIASTLETKFPEQILEFYRRGLGSYDVSIDRKAYAEQAKAALKIRHMLLNVMNLPEKWNSLLQDMKSRNRQRKAFLEEFSKVIPDWGY